MVVRTVGAWWLLYVGDRNGKSLHDMLASWDGQWMLALAGRGYDDIPAHLTDAHGGHSPDTAYAFFPGYPMVVRALDALPGMSTYAAAIAISLVAGAAATVAAYRIGRWCALRRWPADEDRGDRTGLLMAVLFAATPMSVVLTMAYTEAIYCAFAGWALWMILEKRWIAAGLLTVCAGATRTTAVGLIAVLLIAAFLARRDGWRPWVGGAIAPLGWLGWIVFVGIRVGAPNGWFQVQSDGWDTRFDVGLSTLRYLRDTLSLNQTAGDVFTAWVILATVCLIVLAFVTRLPWQVSLYGTLAASTVLLSTGLMNSRVRLLLPAFVLLTPVALALAQRSRTTQVTVGVATTVTSAWFGAYMLGIYPYAI
ncbi:membrane protein [Flexivirga endophytica]|uniref:Membrane protein n=1 Tax=Flexivirga endophytica TaxID=1849103 RepID=A0A916T0H4_9MICO|nr:glycosyltransferase 87 family protein [Flexivirga endophytica]GGB24915.1 membrane protein [Flexivirga endophytica]GHB63648.1 membrane protein [Flexivirga endophytica]